MKIKVESDKLVKAVKKLDGIEIVLETPEDAKEAIDLVLRKPGLFKQSSAGHLKDVKVSSSHEYKSSAVDYRLIFVLDFLFEEGTRLDLRASVIKELQEFFSSV